MARHICGVEFYSNENCAGCIVNVKAVLPKECQHHGSGDPYEDELVILFDTECGLVLYNNCDKAKCDDNVAYHVRIVLDGPGCVAHKVRSAAVQEEYQNAKPLRCVPFAQHDLCVSKNQCHDSGLDANIDENAYISGSKESTSHENKLACDPGVEDGLCVVISVYAKVLIEFVPVICAECCRISQYQVYYP